MGGLINDYGTNSAPAQQSQAYLHNMGQYAAYQMNMHHPAATSTAAPPDANSNGSPTANSAYVGGSYLIMPSMLDILHH